jgi:hypothetical protein
VRRDRASILACGRDRAMHDDILELGCQLGEQRSVASHITHGNGKGVALTIEATINPVTCVKDITSGLCRVFNVSLHLEVEKKTIMKTVQAFCQVDILGASKDNRAFRITLDSGETIRCIMGDAKADCHTDAYNQYTPCGSGKNVIEFVVDTPALSDEARQMGDISYSDDTFEGNISKIERIEE